MESTTENLKNIEELIEKKNDELDINFINFYYNFQKENPLNALNESCKTRDELAEKTKDIINKFFEYQNEYYKILKNELDKNNKLNDAFEKVAQRYSILLKKQNKFNDLNQEELFNSYLNNKMKQKEIQLLNDITNLKKEENEFNKCIFQKESNDGYDKNETKNLLIKTIQNIVKNKNVPLEQMIDKDQEETFKRLQEKYNLTNNTKTPEKNNEQEKNKVPEEHKIEEKIVNNNPIPQKPKINNIIATNYEEMDYKLDNYLNEFYSKHNLPKIAFKKSSKNNYEYGTQKVVLKIEGDNIFRIKLARGFINIDKFIEINAGLESMKLKSKTGSKKKLPLKK